MHLLDFSSEIFELLREYLSRKPNLQVANCLPLANSSLVGRSFNTNEREYFFEYECNIQDDIRLEKQWRNLLNTTKLFDEVKKKSIYLTLMGPHALRYTSDPEFRTSVDQRVQNRQRQIRIYGDFEDLSSHDYFRWDGLHALFFRELRIPVDFTGLTNILILSFFRCDALRFLSNLPNLQVLDVVECSNITVISRLPRLQQLYLDACDVIAELSELPPLQLLNIANCPKIVVTQSMIKSCQSHFLLSEYDPQQPGEGSSLSLAAATPVAMITKRSEFFSWFHHLRYIDLHLLDYEIDCSIFTHVEELFLDSCTAITSIEALSSLKRISVANCPRLHRVDFGSLPLLQVVDLDDCPGLTHLTIQPATLKEANASNGSPTSLNPDIRTINLTSCSNLRKIDISRRVLKLRINSLANEVAHPVHLSIGKSFPIPRLVLIGNSTMVMNLHKR